MSAIPQLADAIRAVFNRPARGVVDLVDDLLTVCQEQGLQLDWQADGCRVRSGAGGPDEVIEQPLQKSAFRAVLARVAALCNEQRPNSVSPYGGQTELAIGGNEAAPLRVSFANTPDDQWLRVAQA
jgi:hypothetical protein